MRRPSTSAVFANPVLVGAVTILVITVAVFLAYNANSGLPFVPTYELKAHVPNGAQLVAGNEVREGGHRIGTITEITPNLRKDKTTGAELLMQLDAEAGPVPADSTVRIRPRSALGLKYVELERGDVQGHVLRGRDHHRRSGSAGPRAAGVLQPLRRARRATTSRPTSTSSAPASPAAACHSTAPSSPSPASCGPCRR